MQDEEVFALERPHPSLMILYVIRSVLTGPFLIVVLPVLFCRYVTLRYRFDDEGVTMQWGLLFRHEVRLNHSRIQDIHLTSGILQRWLGFADIQIQTAAGSVTPEMTIEGLKEYEAVRDYLYRRMRGYKEPRQDAASLRVAAPAGRSDEQLALLRDLAAELRATRQALEKLAAQREAGRNV